MNKLKTKIGIMSICAVALTYMALSPVLASIGAEFSEVSETLVQMIITLPSLLFIAFSPLSGIAMGYIKKKYIALIALACYLVGGLFPFVFNSSIWELLAGSAIIGIGTGLLMPLINGFIVQYFEKSEQAGLMGLNATFTAVGALTFIFIGGQLAKLGWRYSYLAFLLVIPIILIVIICLPGGEPQRISEEAKEGATSEGQFEMNPYIFGLFLIGFIYFVTQNAYNTNSSAYVAEALGAGAGVASIITMANTLGGIVGGATFRGINSIFKNQIETFTLTLIAVGFFIAYFIPNLVAIIVGSLLVGYGYALFNAGGTYLLAQNTRPDTNAFTVSVYLAFINIGAAISPIVVNACASMIGDSAATKYIFAGVVIAITAAYSMILNIKKR